MPTGFQRCDGRHRRRREVRRDAEPDRRLHLQHRLRAGRSRRAAGQPHALQPVLSGEARVLPREPGDCSRFGGVRRRSSGGDTPMLFYSRRIGFDMADVRFRFEAADASPAGSGRYSLGMLNIADRRGRRRRARRATNFSVVRVKRDVLRRSSIGLHRHRSFQHRRRHGEQPGVRRRRHVRVLRQPRDQHLLGSHADRRRRPATTPAIARSSTTRAIGTACRWSASSIGDDFNPDIGFVRRGDMRRHYGQLRFSPRPQIEPHRPEVLMDRLDGVHRERRRPRSRRATATASSASSFRTATVHRQLQRHLRVPAGRRSHRSGVTIPVGGYDYATTRVGYNFGRQRRMFGQRVRRDTASSTAVTRRRSRSARAA